MNKEEYRKEVLKQIREQNEHLYNIEICLGIIIVFVVILAVAVFWQNCAIDNIENYVGKLGNSDKYYKLMDALDDIKGGLNHIIAQLKHM